MASSSESPTSASAQPADTPPVVHVVHEQALPAAGERLTRVLFFGTVLLIAWLMWKVVQPFVLEIGWAAVLAICLNPIRNHLTARIGRTYAAIVIVVGLLLLVILPTIFVGYTLYHEGATGVDYVQRKLDDQGGPAALFHRFWYWARQHAPVLPQEEDVIAGIAQKVGAVLEMAASRAGSILASVVGFVFSLIIMLSILFFLLKDSPELAATLRRVMPFEPEQNDRFVDITSELVSASVTSTLAISAIQGVVGGITFLLLGVPGSILWGVMLAILSFLPLVGSALVWVPVGLWLLVAGYPVKALIVALVGFLILGNVDNVVRPLLLSGKSQVNTLLLIISLMGGVSAFGFIGIVLGPLVAVLLTAIVETYAARPPHSGAA